MIWHARKSTILEMAKNHMQFAFKIRERERERRPGIKVKVLPLVISAFGGGIKEILKEPANIFEKDD